MSEHGTHNGPSQEELIAHIEGSLRPEDAKRVRERIEASDEVRREYEWLQGLWGAFADVNRAHLSNVPEVDLVDGVMAAANATAARSGPPLTDEALAFQDDLIDLLDGGLSGEEAATARSRMDESPSHRLEHEAFAALFEDLEALGSDAAGRAGKVDVVDAVMRTVSGEEARERVIEFPATTRRRRTGWWAVGVVAAAAAGLVVFALAWQAAREGGSGGVEPKTAAGSDQTPVERPDATDAGQQDTKEDLKASKDKLLANAQRIKDFKRATEPEAGFESVDAPDLSEVTLDDLVAARREAASDQSAWTRILQLASLTPEAAAALAESDDAPPEALVGAASALPSTEAERVLLEAMGHFPDDPSVRFAMLRTHDAQVGAADGDASLAEVALQIDQDIQALKELDPDNALPYYIEARARLQQGDVEGALELIEIARQFKEASAYSLDNALHRSEALEAAGMSEDAARLASAMTAGMDEYTFLCELGDELLAQGETMWNQGDEEAAQQLFEAAHQLGEQIEIGAVLFQEQLAALDIQSAALNLLGDFYATFGLYDQLDGLTTEALTIEGSLSEMFDIFSAIENLFFGQGDSGFWSTFADAILEEGDLSLFDRLNMINLPLLDLVTPGAAADSDSQSSS